MLILMKPGASDGEIAEVLDRVGQLGFTAHRLPGAQRVAIGITGNQGAIDPAYFSRCAGVAEAVAVSKPWKQVSRDWRPEDSIIRLESPAGAAQFGGGSFGVIAGPCAVENREQLMASADGVKAGGA